MRETNEQLRKRMLDALEVARNIQQDINGQISDQEAQQVRQDYQRALKLAEKVSDDFSGVTEWKKRAESAEAALAAMPLEAMRRYFAAARVSRAIKRGDYPMGQAMDDQAAIQKYLESTVSPRGE